MDFQAKKEPSHSDFQHPETFLRPVSEVHLNFQLQEWLDCGI
jgi:hypothetical protein